MDDANDPTHASDENAVRSSSWMDPATAALAAVALWVSGAVNLAAPLIVIGALVALWREAAADLRREMLRCAKWAAIVGWPSAIAINLFAGFVIEGPPHSTEVATEIAVLWPDEAGYIADSLMVAELWANGEFPRLSDKEYLGTLHTGYQRVGAYLVGAFGAGRTPFIVLNMLLLPAIGAMIALLAWTLSGGPPADLRLLRAVAAHPMHGFWAAFVLRESLHIAVILALLSLVVGMSSRRCRCGPIHWLAPLAAAWWLATIRSYTALLVALVALLWGGSVVRRIGLLPWLGAAALAALVAAFEPTIGGALAQMTETLTDVFPDYPTDPLGLAKMIAVSVPRLLWSPYPWVLVLSLFVFLYPANWFQALYLWPRVLARLARRDAQKEVMSAPVALPLLCAGALALSILVAFAGDAPRHAYPMTILATLPAALLPDPKTRASRLAGRFYFAALALFVAVQIVKHL